MKTSRRPLGQVRRAMLVATALSAGSSALMLGLPIGALLLVESAVPAGSGEIVILLAAATAGLLITTALIDLCREVVLVRAAYWVDHTIGLSVVETAGVHLGRHAEAVHDLREALVTGRLNAFTELPWAVLGCVALGVLDPLLALASLGSLAIVAAAFSAFAWSSARGSRQSVRHRNEARNWTGTLAANPSLMSEQGLGAGAGQRWEALNRGHVAFGYRAALRLGAGRTTIRALGTGAIACVLGAGALLAIGGDISSGAVLAAMIVTARAIGVIEQAAFNWTAWRDARRAWLLLAACEVRAARAPAKAMAAVSSGIVMTGASFHHGGVSGRDREPHITGVELSIAPGSVLAIVGGEGAGKSALAALIAGVQPASSGRAEIDGVAIALAQLWDAGAPVGYLPDDPRLVEGSVLQNIAGFRREHEALAIDAAILAGVHPMIEALPEGYATNVGRDGRGIPLRIRRAIALARALCGNRRFIVLDAPETALDPVGLLRLEHMIFTLRHAGVGVVLATNEARLVRLADQVAVVVGGRLDAVMSAARFLEKAAGPAGAPVRDWPRRVA